jgi:hypothetical protein
VILWQSILQNLTIWLWKVSEMLALSLKHMFDPTGDQGLGYEGHIVYTATRTRLINDQLTKWVQAAEGTK